MGFYVLDENNNKHEALDLEGVLNAIETAIANGSLAGLVADAGFISKLKCCVSGSTNKIGFIPQAKYNELEANGLVQTNTLYFITDDTTAADMDEQLSTLTTTLNNIVNGVAAVPKATNAETANEAKTAKSANKITMYSTFEETPLSNIFEYGDDFKPTGRVWEAAEAEKLTTKLITARNSDKGAPITKAGLYAITISLAHPNTATTATVEHTMLLNVNKLEHNVRQSLILFPSSSYESYITVMTHSYGNGTYSIRAFKDGASTEYINITYCRLITEY